MKVVLLMTYTLLFAVPAVAAPENKGEGQKKPAQPTMRLNSKPVTEEIYKLTTKEEVQVPSLTFIAGVGVIYLDKLRTSNGYFTTDHAADSRTRPVTFLAAQFLLRDRGLFRLSSRFSSGYSYSSSHMTLQSAVGTSAEDSVTTEWVPLMANISGAPGTSWKGLTPRAFIGGGNNWIRQTGYLDGSSYTAWLPAAALGLGLSIKTPAANILSNIDIDLEQTQSISKHNKLRTTSVKIGFRVN